MFNGANVTSQQVTMTTITQTTQTTTIVSSGQQATETMSKTRESMAAKREKKAAKTLVIITGAFVACWLPFFVVALVQAICSWEAPDFVASVFLWLGYLNSTLNPVIYTIFSPEFRQAFKRMLCSGARAGAR